MIERLARGGGTDQSAAGALAARLRKRFKSEAVCPADEFYYDARRVWNGMVDKYPAAVAYCASARDVADALDAARGLGLPVAVRSGGHNVAGASVCDGGLVIDLSRMKAIEVDTGKQVAQAGAGLTLAEFDAATQACGLATTMGVNGDTGIAGLTLGGGFGKLGRRFGLTCDNLLSADVVTADGRFLQASDSENPDLFWALRGGGGNFGIVTAFRYRLHALGPEILSGSLLYGSAHVRDAMRRYARYSADAPDTVSADAALVSSADGSPMFGISPFFAGSVAEGGKELACLQGWGSPIEDSITTKSYLEVQSAGDSVFPRGRRYYWKAQFLNELHDGAIDALLETFSPAPSPECMVVLQHVGGAIARVAADATAYANREALHDCFPVAIWDDPADDGKHVDWVRRIWSALRPFSSGGAYANNLGEEGAARIREAYRGNYDRLAALKRKYDPDNVFSSNLSLLPARAD